MKQLILFFSTTVLVFLASLLFPWWIAGVICFVINYLVKPGNWQAFAVSLLSVFLIWYLKAFISDYNFDIPVSSLLGKLLGNISNGAVFFLTAIVGALPATLAGLLGNWTRAIVSKP